MVHDARFLDHHFQPFEQVHSAPVSLDPTQSHRIPMLAVHFEGRLQFDPKARPSQLSGQLIQNLLVAPSRQGNPTQGGAITFTGRISRLPRETQQRSRADRINNIQ